MRHFVAVTTRIPQADVVVGRKTALSLPSTGLPGRRVVVVTTKPQAPRPGWVEVASLAEALRLEAPARFVAGGGTLYRQAMGVWKVHLNKAFVTLVPEAFDGDLVVLDAKVKDELLSGPRSDVTVHPNGCTSFVVDYNRQLQGGPPRGPKV